MKKKDLPLSKVYQLLESGPVIMVTTSDEGKANIMTMSWHMMVDFEPPLIAIVMSDQNYSFAALKKTKECVINIPTVELAKQVVGVGNTTGSRTDKFKKFNLTQTPASKVQAPLIDECYANLECQVIDTKMATKYNIFILKVVKAWISTSKKRPLTIHHCGNGIFNVDGKVIKLASEKK
ncbi:MAG: flavin reductase family protein [Candidatus Dependentiae bacterium]|nr:flavin reductase family protein [Candidatus Dependentiae bacterium]